MVYGKVVIIKVNNTSFDIKLKKNYIRNYCQGNGEGVVSGCGPSSAAYNWASAPHISEIATSAATSYVARGLFLGMFILFFIGCGFSFVFWLCSLPICCLKRRGWGYSMSSLVLLNFCIMLTAFIMSLVAIFKGMKLVTGLDGWSGQAGNSVWLTISSLVSLLISFLCYTGGTTCGGWRKKSRNAIDPNYRDKYNSAPNSTQPLYMASPAFDSNTNTQMNNQGNMAQQPYSPEFDLQQQQPQQQTTTTHIVHNQEPNSVSVPMNGYQTPTIQPAVPPH